MSYFYFIILLSLIKGFSLFAIENNYSINKKLNLDKIRNKIVNIENSNLKSLYSELKLNNFLEFEVFSNAVNGLNRIKASKKDILTIIDFSSSSLKKRFFVIDLKKKKVLYSTYVMHGKNSGDEFTTSFSNTLNSYQSSPGFFVTENSYIGAYGYSLRLKGLEKGINDKAKERAIVIHGSQYANPIPGAKSLSKSLGCPAIPKELSKEVIDLIKNGSVIYAHTNKQFYLKKSSFI
ncbi:MAG: murein L,D-transpeptidase catalytic domain family protein [Cetobacterium sp.]|uniref:murein L,D-transpeptidase catalytic domain family protein n=1 Tax=Cetobacterium sp. TaxID=2071632 RepID=UPI002FC9B106